MAKISLQNKGFKNILAEGEKLKQATEVRLIPLVQIVANRSQPRSHFHETKINELAESIKGEGVLQPILIREIDKDKYEIITGERRYRASKIVNLETIPAIVKSSTDQQSSLWALIENIQREDLNSLDQALAFSDLIKKYKYTQLELAKIIGKSRSSVTNILRLLELDNYTKEYLESGYLEMGHARALLALTAEEQMDAVNKIIDGKLNVRQTEQLVQRIKNPVVKVPTILSPEERFLLDTWRQRLLPYTSQVKVKMDNNDKIKLTIECDTAEEAEQLINEIERVKSPS